MTIQSDVHVLNDALLEQLQSPGLEKKAADAVTEFTRTQVRETGLYRKIIPMVPVTNADLDREVSSTLPTIVVDKEPGSPSAATIPFRTMPMNWYISAPRYRVTFARITTPRFQADVDELRTYDMDVRQVISDNAVKDILYEEDAAFFTAVNTILVSAGTTLPSSGVAQWETIVGGITRDTLEEAFKIIPRTPSGLECQTVVCNSVSIRDVLKAGRDEIGGDLSERLFVDGWILKRFMNADWYITIKRNLVPDDTIYMFADPRFVGKSFALEDTTMHVKREMFMIQFAAYELIGGAIGFTDGIARADFA